MIDENEIFVIEYYSQYADEFIVGGIAYGMEAAWRVAEAVCDKHYAGDHLTKKDWVKPAGYYNGPVCYVWIKSATDACFLHDFQDLP